MKTKLSAAEVDKERAIERKQEALSLVKSAQRGLANQRAKIQDMDCQVC